MKKKKVSKYQVVKFIDNPLPIENKRSFVAIVSCDDYPDHPFKVVVENAASAKEARDDVDRWIAAREQEDAAALLHKDEVAEDTEKEKILAELNNL